MRILWLCNICLPVIAKHLGLDAGNKEGWLTGLSQRILLDENSDITLGVCFPADKSMENYVGHFEVDAYAFYEDTAHPEKDCDSAIPRMREIIEDFQPDLVHIFGTEYPHTLAMVKAFGHPERTLIGIQGLCYVYADAFLTGLPEYVYKRRTLRDVLKQDSILQQQEKYRIRGNYEQEALKMTGNVTGRTDWDHYYTTNLQPKVHYHFMNETLRPTFYQGQWDIEACEKHSIFISQGDYPIKGLHFVLQAMPEILRRFPGTMLYVSGNCIVGNTFKKKLLITSYGKYLKKLIKDLNLSENVVFLGKLNAEEMKQRYLRSNVYICPSSMENSPNSLGEAMILGVPVIASNVGGVKQLLEDQKEGIIYEVTDIAALSRAVTDTFLAYDSTNASKEERIRTAELCNYPARAREHAMKTHNGDINYCRLTEIYEDILHESNIRI